MIVCKFGGSSLSDADQVRKACAIMLADPERKIMVVSAPGKRSNIPGDLKITDRLIALCDAKEKTGRVDEQIFSAVEEHIRSIINGLSLPDTLSNPLLQDILTRAQHVEREKSWTRADLIAQGEIISGKIASQYLQSIGTPARFVDPREAGMLLQTSAFETTILPESYQRLEHLKETKEIVCFPGFFGTNKEGHTVLFSRGGSDITGAVLAKAVKAKRYENWTDRDGVYVVNPDILEPTIPIKEISYREMQELAYMGFSILHPEALSPVIEQDIPVHIRNTNNPSAPGTVIIPQRTHLVRPVTGIAAQNHFTALSLRRVLINHEIGIVHRILSFFVDESINIHHVLTGIDSLSVIVRDEALTLEREQRIRERLQRELNLNNMVTTRHLAAIMMVGEGIRDNIGFLEKVTGALTRKQIRIETIFLNRDDINVVMLVQDHEMKRSVAALYRAFFSA